MQTASAERMEEDGSVWLSADVADTCVQSMFDQNPYWNLEKYEKDGIDREKTWESFLEKYEKIWRRVTEKALPGAKYCIMTGDWRKNHKFYDLTYQTEKILEKCGMKPFDKVVLSYKKISPIKLMLPQAKRLGYTVKVHQTLLVYSF